MIFPAINMVFHDVPRIFHDFPKIFRLALAVGEHCATLAAAAMAAAARARKLAAVTYMGSGHISCIAIVPYYTIFLYHR